MNDTTTTTYSVGDEIVTTDRNGSETIGAITAVRRDGRYAITTHDGIRLVRDASAITTDIAEPVIPTAPNGVVDVPADWDAEWSMPGYTVVPVAVTVNGGVHWDAVPIDGTLPTYAVRGYTVTMGAGRDAQSAVPGVTNAQSRNVRGAQGQKVARYNSDGTEFVPTCRLCGANDRPSQFPTVQRTFRLDLCHACNKARLAVAVAMPGERVLDTRDRARVGDRIARDAIADSIRTAILGATAPDAVTVDTAH